MAELLVTTSARTVADAVVRLREVLASAGVGVFAVIDHAAGARAAGLVLPDEVLVLFGNPRVGTALMQEEPSTGYDLPLRLLIWDDGGTTKVGYRSPSHLVEDYGLTVSVATVDKLTALLGRVASELAK